MNKWEEALYWLYDSLGYAPTDEQRKYKAIIVKGLRELETLQAKLDWRKWKEELK